VANQINQPSIDRIEALIESRPEYWRWSDFNDAKQAVRDLKAGRAINASNY